VFPIWSFRRYKHNGRIKASFCIGICEERSCRREAAESPLPEAVARERLVKTTRQASWMFSGCCGNLWIVEISDDTVTACTSKSCVSSARYIDSPIQTPSLVTPTRDINE
jgi:hypothetical protein